MCGILFFNNNNCNKERSIELLDLIQHRGPDNTEYKIYDNMFFGFHRLSINGLDDKSNQPFYYQNKYILICNGEIYNYKKLAKSYLFNLETNSDCEIIIHLYEKFGINKTLQLLDGVFAFVLYDIENKNFYIARDPIGIRSLYWYKNNNIINVSSELKSIHTFGKCEQFKPGYFYDFKNDSLNQYYSHSYDIQLNDNPNLNIIYNEIKDKFTVAVNKRLQSDRPVGCILSGGLDSTLVTAIVSKNFGPYELNTYTIGLEGSEDLKYARIASEYLKTKHHEFVISEEDFLDFIKETIKQLETYCVTSVRASVGNYMIAKLISEKTDDKVIYCGDVSDEIFGSYRGFMLSKNPKQFFRENLKMLKNIHYFDVLRSEKSMAGAGLEARVPFADLDFVNYIMSLNPKLKIFDDIKIEKDILRNAFKNSNLLPDELLFRRKEAFSDGVSSYQRSWFEIIQEFVDKHVNDNEMINLQDKYPHNTPYDKESLYYRKIFDTYYPKQQHIVPYIWKQPFSTNKDPSARLLECYNPEKTLDKCDESSDDDEMPCMSNNIYSLLY